MSEKRDNLSDWRVWRVTLMGMKSQTKDLIYSEKSETIIKHLQIN